MRLLKSTTFQMAAIINTISAFMVWKADLAPEAWVTSAVASLVVYAGKEGIRYSAEAYKEKA